MQEPTGGSKESVESPSKRNTSPLVPYVLPSKGGEAGQVPPQLICCGMAADTSTQREKKTSKTVNFLNTLLLAKFYGTNIHHAQDHPSDT